MKRFLFLPILLFVCSCVNTIEKTNNINKVTSSSPEEIKTEVNTALENWHNYAAVGDFESYFGLMTKDGIFIGTDATENWGIDEFKNFSKPYFDRGTAWEFLTLDRNIYPAEDGEIAWFDELLETWMGICRGSGVMEREDGMWKIRHYVLSVTIPNDNINEVVKINKEIDSTLILDIRNKK